MCHGARGWTRARVGVELQLDPLGFRLNRGKELREILGVNMVKRLLNFGPLRLFLEWTSSWELVMPLPASAGRRRGCTLHQKKSNKEESVLEAYDTRLLGIVVKNSRALRVNARR